MGKTFLVIFNGLILGCINMSVIQADIMRLMKYMNWPCEKFTLISRAIIIRKFTNIFV